MKVIIEIEIGESVAGDAEDVENMLADVANGRKMQRSVGGDGHFEVGDGSANIVNDCGRAVGKWKIVA